MKALDHENRETKYDGIQNCLEGHASKEAGGVVEAVCRGDAAVPDRNYGYASYGAGDRDKEDMDDDDDADNKRGTAELGRAEDAAVKAQDGHSHRENIEHVQEGGYVVGLGDMSIL